MRYDVIISGAGPAGSTAALILARAGARTLVLDRARFPRDKPCAEYLSPEINIVLRDLGLSALVDAARPARLRGFLIYAQDGRSFRANFAGRAGGVPERSCGLAIPRMALDHLLVQAATAAGAELREGVRVTGCEHSSRGVVVRVARHGNGESIEGRLLLAADGLRSPVARQLGLLRRERPHRVALVTHMEGIDGLQEYGEMHTSRVQGYCGVAPLGGGRANVAMVVDASVGRAIAGDASAYMRSALATYPQLGPRAARARFCKPVLTTSGLSWSARRFHAARIALAGDATGYYDPFTGEGIYRAMAGGQLAGRRLLEGLRTGHDATALAGYEQDLRRLYRGKRVVERVIDVVAHHPLLLYRVASQLRNHPDMADTLVGVTGDFLSPWSVLNPAYMSRLVF